MAGASHSKISKPSLKHWLMMAVIVVFGGSAFAAIKVALVTATPGTIVFGRLWVSAIILTIYALATGRRFPPLFVNKRPSAEWLYMFWGGLIGFVIPFTLYPIAQKSVDSMLAGIYMALMPLMTLVMSFLILGEKLTLAKVLGFILGAVGVVVLMAPWDVVQSGVESPQSNQLLGQLILIGAVLCYAIYGIIASKAPKMQARSYAAGVLICAAVTSTIPLFFWGQDWSAISFSSILGMLFLGVFPSGISAILIIVCIQQVGASFTSLGAYGAPPVAIGLGILMFDEPLKPTFLIGLVIIFAGLALSQSRSGQMTAQMSAMATGLQRMIRRR